MGAPSKDCPASMDHFSSTDGLTQEEDKCSSNMEANECLAETPESESDADIDSSADKKEHGKMSKESLKTVPIQQDPSLVCTLEVSMSKVVMSSPKTVNEQWVTSNIVFDAPAIVASDRNVTIVAAEPVAVHDTTNEKYDPTIFINEFNSNDFQFHCQNLMKLAAQGCKQIPLSDWALDWARQVSLNKDNALQLDRSGKRCLELLCEMNNEVHKCVGA